MGKWHSGEFTPKNPGKYIGQNTPKYKSSWELTMMNLCDNHPYILNWAYESIHIPYKNPLTQRQSIYIPDFLLIYMDKTGRQHSELIEVKPITQTLQERARTRNDRLAVVLNHTKWKAAEAFCRRHQIKFRILTEEQIYRQHRK